MRCRECGYYSPRWMGRCPGCGAWQSFTEEAEGGRRKAATKTEPPRPLSAVTGGEGKRISTGLAELDRVLGGGIVPGAVVLIGGDPGIGKSTLLLQVGRQVAEGYGDVLYVAGEESALQVRLRAERLGAVHDRLLLSAETDVDAVANLVSEISPRLVIVDSIQTVFRSGLQAVPGSLGQVRECTLALARVAKETGVPVFLVGHVTKEGMLAGPRVVEHIVDAVLYLEGERHQAFRILRGVKNRFGSTNEIGVFEMQSTGLVEITNPSRLFLSSGGAEAVPGSVVVSSIEGTRPLLVEIQALVSPSGYGTPRRMTAGVDYNRVVLMAAVLEKRVGLELSNQDLYVNAVGGARLSEPAVDLGIALALASGFRDRALPPRTLAVGEVGLTGEVRAVPALDKRLREAAKLGFEAALVPGEGYPRRGPEAGLRVHPVRTVAEALQLLS